MQKILKILNVNDLLEDFDFRLVVSKQNDIVSVLVQPVLKKDKKAERKKLPVFIAAAPIDKIEEKLYEKILEALDINRTDTYKISEFVGQVETVLKDKKVNIVEAVKDKTEPEKKESAKKILERKRKANLSSKSELQTIEPGRTIALLPGVEPNDPDQPVEEIEETLPESKEDYEEEW